MESLVIWQTYCMDAIFSGKETGRASILKEPLWRFSLATMLVGTVVVSLALETIPDWNIAVFIPMVAKVFTAMLKRSSCMLDVILLCLVPNIL